MVMESPSPQCVGREFVRQYYTMLNQSPLHLHRFYSNNSSFVHGGNDPPGIEGKPVMGQQDIHQKIMQLNFRDCHAKIRQVDSHATLGSGVVVQVTGELSNNGQPMRRFMQTFVLAPQSPKKYYVHNDIFRYQDEVFNDEEDDDEADCVIESDEPEDEPEEQIIPATNPASNVPDSTMSMYYEDPHLSNGTHREETVDSNSMNINEVEQPQQLHSTNDGQTEQDKQSDDLTAPATVAVAVADQTTELVVEPSFEDKPDDSVNAVETTPLQPELKTYANIVGRIGGGYGMKTGNQQQSGGGGGGPLKQDGPGKDMASNNTFNTNHYNRATRNRVGNMSNRGRPMANNMNSRTESGGDDNMVNTNNDNNKERRSASIHSHPDSHQLFVGSLPYNVNDDHLNNFFSKWGNVVDIRINSKQSAKVPTGRPPQPYGFIIFDNEESVKKVLEDRPIMYESTKLNVEVKRNKRGPIMSSGPHPDSRLGMNDRISTGRGGLNNRMSRGGGPGSNRIGGGGPGGGGGGNMFLNNKSRGHTNNPRR